MRTRWGQNLPGLSSRHFECTFAGSVSSWQNQLIAPRFRGTESEVRNAKAGEALIGLTGDELLHKRAPNLQASASRQQISKLITKSISGVKSKLQRQLYGGDHLF